MKAALKLKLSLTWCRLQLKLPLNLTDRCLAFSCPRKEVTVRKAQYQKTDLLGFSQGFVSSSRYLLLQAVNLTRWGRRGRPPCKGGTPPRCHLCEQGKGASCRAPPHCSSGKQKLSLASKMRLRKQSRDYLQAPSTEDIRGCVIHLWSDQNMFLQISKGEGKCFSVLIIFCITARTFSVSDWSQKCNFWKKKKNIYIKNKIQKFRLDQK